MATRTRNVALAALLTLILTTSLAAQTEGIGFTPIGGNVFDGNGGPLIAGIPYLATNSITVPAGQTLTIQPDVVIKFQGATAMTVDGTLVVQGTSLDPVIFTSSRDDSIGGDTNGDGNATTPAAGDWPHVTFNTGSDASVVDDIMVRFAMNGFIGVGADITVRDSLFEDIQADGFRVGIASRPTVSNCTFNRCGDALDQLAADAVTGVTGCVGTANASGDTIKVGAGNSSDVLANNATWTLANTMNGNGVLHFEDHTFEVGVAATLNLSPGIILKFGSNLRLDVEGTLNGNGAAGNPVVVTSAEDDFHGGDSNGDGGATTGAPGQWRGMIFENTSDASVLSHTHIRFGGSGSAPAIDLVEADITLTDVSIEDCAHDALDCRRLAQPTVTGCNFDRCAVPADDVPLAAVPGFTGNTSVGSTQIAAMNISDTGSTTTVNGAFTLDPANAFNSDGVFVFTKTITVPQGATLTALAGATIKFEQTSSVNVAGTLLCQGVTGNEVVFTSLADDVHGGDTNADGAATSPQPGDWGRIFLDTTAGTSALTRTRVRFAGAAIAGVESRAGARLERCRIENCDDDGLVWTASTADVSRCEIDGNNGVAIRGVRLEAVPGFLDNSASGNALGDAMRIENDTFTGVLTLTPSMYPGGALTTTADLFVGPGNTLVLESGVVLKVDGNRTIGTTGNGALHLLGSGLEPVIITGIRDDSVAGDTNGDGAATVASPGDWRRLDYGSGSSPSLCRNVVLRYGGAGGQAGFECDSPLVAALAVRVEHAQADGFDVGDVASPASAWIAHECGGDGLRLDGGSFDVVHATVQGCGGVGIHSLGSHNGAVRNSISFANGGGNFAGYSVARVFDSCGDAGFAGSNGNIDVDPLFTDAAGGDLTLLAASACIDSADSATALSTVVDFDDGPRLSDHDVDGATGADMGAFEKRAFTMTLNGSPKAGTVMDFEVVGPPGLAVFFFGFDNAVQDFGIFGQLLIGDAQTVLFIESQPVSAGGILDIALPANPLLAGFALNFQALAVSFANPNAGNFTNAYRARIFN